MSKPQQPNAQEVELDDAKIEATLQKRAQDRVDAATKEINAVLAKYDVQIVAQPFIDASGRIQASAGIVAMRKK